MALRAVPHLAYLEACSSTNTTEGVVIEATSCYRCGVELCYTICWSQTVTYVRPAEHSPQCNARQVCMLVVPPWTVAAVTRTLLPGLVGQASSNLEASSNTGVCAETAADQLTPCSGSSHSYPPQSNCVCEQGARSPARAAVMFDACAGGICHMHGVHARNPTGLLLCCWTPASCCRIRIINQRPHPIKVPHQNPHHSRR